MGSGSLIDILCSMITSPFPAACNSSGLAKTGPEYKKYCENCDEVPSFRWHRQRRTGLVLRQTTAAVLSAVLRAGLVGGLLAFQRWRVRTLGGNTSNSGEILIAEAAAVVDME